MPPTAGLYWQLNDYGELAWNERQWRLQLKFYVDKELLDLSEDLLHERPLASTGTLILSDESGGHILKMTTVL